MKRLRLGDTVVVLTGKDRGKQGKILKVIDNKVLVERVNIVKKHKKGNPNAGTQGGIIDKTMPINISNVGLYNSETKTADRVGFKFLSDGKKVRYFKSTKKVIDI